jgi:hypothetical protein
MASQKDLKKDSPEEIILGSILSIESKEAVWERFRDTIEQLSTLKKLKEINISDMVIFSCLKEYSDPNETYPFFYQKNEKGLLEPVSLEALSKERVQKSLLIVGDVNVEKEVLYNPIEKLLDDYNLLHVLHFGHTKKHQGNMMPWKEFTTDYPPSEDVIENPILVTSNTFAIYAVKNEGIIQALNGKALNIDTNKSLNLFA